MAADGDRRLHRFTLPDRESGEDLDDATVAELRSDLEPIKMLGQDEVLAILRARLEAVRAIGRLPDAEGLRS